MCAGRALASFAVLGLRIRRADKTSDEWPFNANAARRRRDGWLAHQLRLLAKGDFAKAVECLFRQRASEGLPVAPQRGEVGLPAGADIGPGFLDGEASIDATLPLDSPADPPLPQPSPLAEPPVPLAAPDEPRMLPPSLVRRVCRLVSLGELGKAAAALVQSTAASFCGATFHTIEALHPPAPADKPIPASVRDAHPAPIQVSRDTLVGVLRRMRSGVAGGVTGLTNDHLRCLLPTESDGDLAALDPLLAFVNQVLAGKVDEETADWLCASKLVVLLKPDGKGGFKRRACGVLDLRPIAMPEALYRLVALCGLEEVLRTVTDKLPRAQQLCVGISSTCVRAWASPPPCASTSPSWRRPTWTPRRPASASGGPSSALMHPMRSTLSRGPPCWRRY
jgi:hypothetical protein